ncbi:MAG: response regulator [Myxococcales bacterium]|nr:response regulator [Polyangiaceae bacterium]MDW8252051.1 response regulator [Myxococcales bacterium]
MEGGILHDLYHLAILSSHLICWGASEVTRGVSTIMCSGSSRQGLILVVDDERALRQAIRTLLESEGHQVLEAANGRDALEIVQEHGVRIDLVLLDLQMPEMDGGETLAALRAIDPSIRILLSSGFDTVEILDRVRDQVSGVLSKPFRAAELLRAVQEALAAPRVG